MRPTDTRSVVGTPSLKRAASSKAAALESYEKALREAGVTRDDLALLRELAAANASDLEPHPDHLRPSRILL